MKRPDVCSDSTMWQSPSWLREVATVYRFAPRWRLLNHPLSLAAQLWLRRPRYRAILTTGNKTSAAYGLLCRATFTRQKQVMAELYLDEVTGWRRPIQEPLMRLMLRHIDGVIVTSRGEIPLVEERFGVPRERIRFVPFHTNIIEPEDLGCASGPVWAGGRNFRDYETLVEAARGVDAEFVIVCGADQLLDTPLPPNVTVHRELPYDEYLALLRGASAVVVPLTNTLVPSGQSSILEAMAYGKPVVTTDSVGTADYVRPGVDGYLYSDGDVATLREQLVTLTGDDALRQRLGRAAFEAVMESFTFEHHARLKLEAIGELARG